MVARTMYPRKVRLLSKVTSMCMTSGRSPGGCLSRVESTTTLVMEVTGYSTGTVRGDPGLGMVKHANMKCSSISMGGTARLNVPIIVAPKTGGEDITRRTMTVVFTLSGGLVRTRGRVYGKG